MIIIKNKKCKPENILKEYPGAKIIDVTSHATDEFVRFSPFYPHGGIPVPFSPGYTAYSVEGVWQGLKDFDSCGIDTAVFSNSTMKDLKRTVRKYGHVKGHRKGVRGTEHLGYIEARKAIYAPVYRWVLENKIPHLVKKLQALAASSTIVLLDYNTNPDIEDGSSPLSHASLIKAYIEGAYPTQTTTVGENKVLEDTPFRDGDRVNHPKFGAGTVIDINNTEGKITIQFDNAGVKTLIAALAHISSLS